MVIFNIPNVKKGDCDNCPCCQNYEGFVCFCGCTKINMDSAANTRKAIAACPIVDNVENANPTEEIDAIKSSNGEVTKEYPDIITGKQIRKLAGEL